MFEKDLSIIEKCMPLTDPYPEIQHLILFQLWQEIFISATFSMIINDVP